MTSAQLLSRQITADRRARDLAPAVRSLAADRWAVESARKGGVVYLLSASIEGITCCCPAGSAGQPCYHKSAVCLAVAAVQPEPPTGGPVVVAA